MYKTRENTSFARRENGQNAWFLNFRNQANINA